MYNKIPKAFANHFSGFRSTRPDIALAHRLAGISEGESQVVEIGCGDGRDAENAFVPAAARYIGYDPSAGLLDLARARFPGAPDDMFRLGYAQTTDYPEGTDIMVSINSILHVPKADLPATFERAREGLRTAGVLYVVTKTEPTDETEVYHDDFNGVKGERTFYHHSLQTLATIATEQAGLHIVHQEITPVEAKSWDWLAFAVQK